MRTLRARWIGFGKERSFLSFLPRRRGVPKLRQKQAWMEGSLLARVPRGAGVIASALYLAAWGGYGLVLSDNVDTVVNDTTAELGFKIGAVRITGQRELDEVDVLDTLSIRSGQSLFLYDAAGARERLAANPWISDVSVMKLYPDKVRVILEERVPAALWQRTTADPVAVIDGEGRVITDRLAERYLKLPRVMGDGAEKRVHEISAILDDAPYLQQKVRASMLVSHRRWDLFLDNGVQVMLPEKDVAAAVVELEKLDQQSQLLDRDITVVDLRLTDRVVVRLSDTAKAARDELIKARDKAMKQRARDA